MKQGRDVTHFPTDVSGVGVKAKLERACSEESGGGAVAWAGEEEGLQRGQRGLQAEAQRRWGPQRATTLDSELLVSTVSGELSAQKPKFSYLRRH